MMDDSKYLHAGAAPEPTPAETPAPAEAALSPAAERFKSCRWRATPDAGEYCTHRDVLPFAGTLVEDGDMIELDVDARRLHLDVTEDELARRRARWKPPAPHSARGWVKLYCSTVQQADKGVDLDFLVGGSGAPVGRESH